MLPANSVQLGGGGTPCDLPHDPGILIVDDDPCILNLLGVALPLQGFRVWTARNEEAALRLADSLRGHLVVALVDLTLGSEAGLQVLDALRARLPGGARGLVTGPLTREASGAAL